MQQLAAVHQANVAFTHTKVTIFRPVKTVATWNGTGEFLGALRVLVLPWGIVCYNSLLTLSTSSKETSQKRKPEKPASTASRLSDHVDDNLWLISFIWNSVSDLLDKDRAALWNKVLYWLHYWLRARKTQAFDSVWRGEFLLERIPSRWSWRFFQMVICLPLTGQMTMFHTRYGGTLLLFHTLTLSKSELPVKP